MLRSVGEINGAPFNVEDTIGRSTRHRGVNAAGPARETCAASPPQIIGALVVPVREDGAVVVEPGQTHVGKVGTCSRKLGIAIGRHIDACVSRATGRIRERQHDVGYYIIPVIARVRCAWHDTAAYLSYVKAGAGCRRWGWCRSRR